jgi:hypothetical protein
MVAGIAISLSKAKHSPADSRRDKSSCESPLRVAETTPDLISADLPCSAVFFILHGFQAMYYCVVGLCGDGSVGGFS